jgi:hypothetical protein
MTILLVVIDHKANLEIDMLRTLKIIAKFSQDRLVKALVMKINSIFKSTPTIIPLLEPLIQLQSEETMILKII